MQGTGDGTATKPIGTGNGGSAAATWTAADRQNLIVILILGSIGFALLLAIMIVRQEAVRTNLVVMASGVIGALAGVLRGGQPQHNTQGVEAANVENVSVQPTDGSGTTP